MNINAVGTIFSGQPDTLPVCPKCGSRQIGNNALFMVCGSCEWYSSIDINSSHHTGLTRYKVATSMREAGGEKFFHYFLPGEMDGDDRNLAEKRLFERCSRVTATRQLRDMVHGVLTKAIMDDEFRKAYSGQEFPSELWFGVHGRKHDGSDMGAFIQDVNNGLFFGVGSFISNMDPPVGNITYPQMVKNVASGASWEILARRRAEYSCFIRMQAVTPETPIFGEKYAGSEHKAYRFTVSKYGFYPVHLVVQLEGWTPETEGLSVMEGKSCEEVSISNIHIDEEDIVGDDILMQPISWSAFRISGGPDLKEDWSPRYVATLYSPRYLVTCAVSEEQNRGEFVARAAVRNVQDGNLVSLKKVNGGSVEECIQNAQNRNSEIKKIEEKKGDVFIMERSWDVLDTDPLASLMEIRNLTCWNSDIGHRTMAKRVSDILG